MYLNGVKRGLGFPPIMTNNTAGSGEVVVGRLYPSTDDFYSSLRLDELMFYNRKLCSEELQDLFDMYA